MVLAPFVLYPACIDLDLQAKWIFTSTFLTQVFIWGTFFHINCTCLQLVCFGPSGFEVSLLFWKHMLVKCPNLWQALHWFFFCWTLESLQVGCVSTIGTSVIVIVYAFRVKPLLILGLVHGNSHWLVACGLIVLTSQVVFSSCICLLATLCDGVWGDWFVQLLGPLLPALCYVQWLYSSLAFWQAVSSCLQEIYLSLHFHHWWFRRQTPHLSRKPENVPVKWSWQFLGVFC